MRDRGMIKWAPFNSVISSEETLRRVALLKNRKEMPCLSEEQRQAIEERILEAFYLNDVVDVIYYRDGRFWRSTGKIKEINQLGKWICLNDKKRIYFGQMVKIVSK